MNARIAPTPVGVRRSRLNRLGMAVSTKRDSLPASGLPATGIEEVTNRSSVPSGPSVATAVVRTRPPTFSPTSVPGMRIEPGKSPADTTSFGTSGICCTDASISASRSSTAALTVGAGAAFAISARRLLAESESCFVSSSCLRSSAISRFCSASARPCSETSFASSATDGAAGGTVWAGDGAAGRQSARASIARRSTTRIRLERTTGERLIDGSLGGQGYRTEGSAGSTLAACARSRRRCADPEPPLARAGEATGPLAVVYRGFTS